MAPQAGSQRCTFLQYTALGQQQSATLLLRLTRAYTSLTLDECLHPSKQQTRLPSKQQLMEQIAASAAIIAAAPAKSGALLCTSICTHLVLLHS